MKRCSIARQIPTRVFYGGALMVRCMDRRKPCIGEKDLPVKGRACIRPTPACTSAHNICLSILSESKVNAKMDSDDA